MVVEVQAGGDLLRKVAELVRHREGVLVDILVEGAKPRTEERLGLRISGAATVGRD